MRLHLQNLKSFSNCPAYYCFSKDKQVLIPRRRVVIESIIKKCYMQATETGHRTSWRTIVGWVDREIFKDIEIQDDESFRAAKSFSENVLLSVQKWYKFYLEENFENYIDIDLYQEIGDCIVYGTAPVIHVGKEIILTVFNDLGITRLELYNDLEVRGLVSMLSNSLDGSEIQVRCLAIGPQGGFDIIEFIINQSNRVEQVLKQLCRSLRAGHNYPSRNVQCKSCEYIRKCKL